MTREEAKELLPIIQAFAEGKTIEFINDDGEWEEVDFPTWGKCFTYRIRLEPKYRPFNNQEECWEEMQNHHPFGWIKKKGNYINITLVPEESSSYDKSLKNTTFADGTPFGIKEE